MAVNPTVDDVAESCLLESIEVDSQGKVFTDSRGLKCFVIMPFGSRKEYDKEEKESNFIFKYIICPAIKAMEKFEKRSIEVIREVDKSTAGNITKSILNNIARADICIVDITGLNPNVFFELGIRYSLKEKITILIKQANTEMPFDISGFKCISYDCYEPDEAILSIADFLINGRTGTRYIDSLVFEVFPEMRVEIPGLLDSVGEKRSEEGHLSWSQWWKKVIELSNLLRDAYDNGRFVPHAVLGISNGGLMLSDLLVREVFKGKPVLSLWADRQRTDRRKLDRACYYFDNPFNIATIKTIKEFGAKNPTLLLVDDIVSTGATSEQASYFLNRELENCQILFTPLYCRSKDYLEAISTMLPTGFKDGKAFPNIREDEYANFLASGDAYLPYNKVLGGEKRPYAV